MKKLVITTQYMENYGSMDNPYMKFKGGSTYIMKNCGDLDSNEQATVVAKIRPYITTNFIDSNGGCEEYIVSDAIVDYNEKVCDEWETPIEFSMSKGDVYFIKVLDNQSEAGYLRKSILTRTETWVNDRQQYKVEYLLEDGSYCNEEELRVWLDTNDVEPEVKLPEAG